MHQYVSLATLVYFLLFTARFMVNKSYLLLFCLTLNRLDCSWLVFWDEFPLEIWM